MVHFQRDADHTSTPSSGCSFKGYQQFTWVVMLLDTAAIPFCQSMPNGPPVGHNSSLELCFSSAKTWSCHWMMSADPRSKFLPVLQVVKSPGLNDEATPKEARFEKRKRHTRISCDRASQCSSMSNQFHHIIYFIICMKYSYFTPQSLVCSGGEKIADHTMTDLPVI